MNARGAGPTVVEFFGMPGAGKTFLAQRLRERLARTGVEVDFRAVAEGMRTRPRRVGHRMGAVAALALRHPGQLRRIGRFVALSPPRTRREYAKVLANWAYVVTRLRSRGRLGTLVVLDQGVTQALWTSAFHSETVPDPDAGARFLCELLLWSGVESLRVLHVKVDTATLRARIQGRSGGASPLDRSLGGGAFQRALDATAHVEGTMVRVVERLQPAVSLIEVDNPDGADSPALWNALAFTHRPRTG